MVGGQGAPAPLVVEGEFAVVFAAALGYAVMKPNILSLRDTQSPSCNIYDPILFIDLNIHRAAGLTQLYMINTWHGDLIYVASVPVRNHRFGRFLPHFCDLLPSRLHSTFHNSIGAVLFTAEAANRSHRRGLKNRPSL